MGLQGGDRPAPVDCVCVCVCVCVSASLLSLFPPSISLSSLGLNGSSSICILGSRLLLGINKSWGFLSRQLSGGGTWKEGQEGQEGFQPTLGSRAAWPMGHRPQAGPRSPRGLLSSWRAVGRCRAGMGCMELGAQS